MSPSKEFYEKLRAQIETDPKILAPFLSAQFPENPHKFFTEIITGRNVNLYGLLVTGPIDVGVGDLDIPINIADYRAKTPYWSALQRFASRNKTVLNFQNVDQAYGLLDLKFDAKYDDLRPSTFGSGESFYLMIDRRPDNWYREFWRDIPYRPEREDFAKSAIGLSQHVKDILGWQINPLSYEETVKTSR